MDDYIAKAKELGQALADLPEIQKIKEAEEEISKDPKALAVFQDYQTKERNMMTAKLFGKVISEKDSIALIDYKMRIMRNHEVIRNFFQLQQDFEKLMATVNLVITTTIYGMPSADQLPLPPEIKGMAQQLLNNLGLGSGEAGNTRPQ